MQKIPSDKLSNKEFWDSIYQPEALKEKRGFLENYFNILVKKFLGKKIIEYIREYALRSYADYLLWNVIYKKYMPKIKGAKALEIGSAPGDYLVRLNQAFGFIPYGIDYSKEGVELNRRKFILHNINPKNVIYADFLSDEFHKQYRGYFDIVVSRGFLEHFSNVDDIIEKHINLLSKGGYLFVNITNFKGFNYILAYFFHKKLLSIHNLNIMQKRKFSEIFNKEHLSKLFCDYYGTFNFGLFNIKVVRSFLKRFILSCCNSLQLILNIFFRFLFKDKGAENRFFSPYLLFIGIKKE